MICLLCVRAYLFLLLCCCCCCFGWLWRSGVFFVGPAHTASGAQSYAARGVTEAQYQVYWDSYVEPRWQKHGASRATDAAVVGGSGDKGSHLALSCHNPVPQLVQKLLATGWFQRDERSGSGSQKVAGNDALSGEAAAKASAARGSSSSGRNNHLSNGGGSSSDTDESSDEGREGISGASGGFISQSSQSSQSKNSSQSVKSSQSRQSTTGNAGAPGQPRPRPLPGSTNKTSEAASSEDSDTPRYKDDVGLPAATSIAFAVLATGLLSTLGTAHRSAVFAVLGSGWWYFRGRR